MAANDMTDHAGARLNHGRARVNGVKIHYAFAGSGDPVYLVHGAPKTMFIWRHLVPLLTEHHTVVLLDCRGYGESERPLTGYDTRTMGDDVVALADHLGHQRFRLVGEDWGAAIAYSVAAFHRERVEQLVYQEMRLPGADQWPPAADLALDDPRTGWHFAFFSVPHFPELLMAGRERPFWTSFVRQTMADPAAARAEDLDEIVGWVERPGGLHTILSVYRAKDLDAEQNRTQFAEPLDIPVLAIGGADYLAADPLRNMEQVATDVRGVILPNCGHNPSLEAPDRLAEALLKFFGSVA
jgi:pimeloyl-ACP methyl ester carboxylesterase